MKFLKSLLGRKLNGELLAQSDRKEDFAQIELLAYFAAGAPTHDALTQQRWSRVLPREYGDQIALFQDIGWLDSDGNTDGETLLRLADGAKPFVDLYSRRLEQERAAIMPKVRAALERKDTSEALELRRAYEARTALGEAQWTGPEPQLSHSSLTRRILFLEHWLLDGLSLETVDWIKLYAAEQHLWGTYWRLTSDEIPKNVMNELTTKELTGEEMAYWKSYQLALHVDNQETWQRCSGGDHVRRIRIVRAAEGTSCAHCLQTTGKEFLVARVPKLPHKECTSVCGCLCRYEPVLESYEHAT